MDPVCELATRVNEYYIVLHQMICLLLIIIAWAIGNWVGLSTTHDERWCLFCRCDDVRSKVAVA